MICTSVGIAVARQHGSATLWKAKWGGECDYPENDRVVSYYHCSNCGSDYEFRQGRKVDEDE